MLINYKNVNIYQPEGAQVLESVNLEVDNSEFVYITGRVGSGKSSLLKTLYCDLDLEEAEQAEVLGYDLLTIRRKEIPALRRKIGIVFQDFQLLTDRTVRKNLNFVLRATGWKHKADIANRIEEVLSDVDLLDKIDRMPSELSGGEQQRIAIARAVLNKPELIIADEPTGNLDHETADDVMLLLRRISDTGTAVIMSTHNMAMLRKYPGKAYRCQDGKLEMIHTQTE